jgi:uncharacterized protein (DUF111 family)
MSDAVVYLEPLGGIAGDMFLAAALDAGVDAAALQAQLATLRVPQWRLHVEKASRHMIWGTHVDVHVEGHAHDAHDTNSGHHPHGHRSLADIRALIEASGLAARAKERALRVFTRLGEVEA